MPRVLVLGRKCTSVYRCVRLSVSAVRPLVSATSFSPRVPVHLSVICRLPSACVFRGVQEIFISSCGALVTPRGCAIRRTARPSGQPSRFIISQCQRDRRGNSTDQWAEVEARLNFLSKCVWVCLCVSLTVCVCAGGLAGVCS